MKLECGWCQKDMGKVPGGEGSDDTSHGICPTCYEKEMKKIDALKEKKENSENKPPENNFPLK